MPKRPEIANEDEYRGWREVLAMLELTIVHAEYLRDTRSETRSNGGIAAATKARDAILPAIRRYQEEHPAEVHVDNT